MGNGHNNGAEHGVEHIKVPTVIITLDPATLLVSFQSGDLIISVVQMMLDEVQRQLDIKRRQAAAIELQKQLADAARTAAIVAGLKGKG